MPFDIEDIRIEIGRGMTIDPELDRAYLFGFLSGMGVQRGLLSRLGALVCDVRMVPFLKENAGRKLDVLLSEFNKKQKLKYPVLISDFVTQISGYRGKALIRYFVGFELGLEHVSELQGSLSDPRVLKEETILKTLSLLDDLDLWVRKEISELN